MRLSTALPWFCLAEPSGVSGRSVALSASISFRATYRQVACDETIMQLALLALDLGREGCVFLLQSPQRLMIGAVGGTHQVRQHMDVAEHRFHDVIGRRRMRQRGPIGAWDVALLEASSHSDRRAAGCFAPA